MRSTSDQVSGHRHMRSPDELTLPLRPSQSRMSWPPSDSACDPDVKGRCRAVRAASGFAVAVPHARAATVSVRCGHSGQGDFVKLSTAGPFQTSTCTRRCRDRPRSIAAEASLPRPNLVNGAAASAHQPARSTPSPCPQSSADTPRSPPVRRSVRRAPASAPRQCPARALSWLPNSVR
jgi:hypothetical protein